MALNIAKEVARMKRMTVPELRRQYAEVFGEECRSRHKRFLLKRIAWRLQANAEGDLPKRARQRAAGSPTTRTSASSRRGHPKRRPMWQR